MMGQASSHTYHRLNGGPYLVEITHDVHLGQPNAVHVLLELRALGLLLTFPCLQHVETTDPGLAQPPLGECQTVIIHNTTPRDARVPTTSNTPRKKNKQTNKAPLAEQTATTKPHV